MDRRDQVDVLTYAVVRAKPGRQVPPHVGALLRDAAPADLAFVPDDHLVWSDDAGRTLVAAWQAGAEHLGVGSRWEARRDIVTVFSGHPLRATSAWSVGSTWAAQLADGCEQRSLVEVADELDGVFTAVSLDRWGRGAVVADPLGIGIHYRAESPDVIVISTRSSVAARLAAPAGQEPRRDPEGVGWLVYANNLQTDRTTFAGVRTVPTGAAVVLETDGSVEVGPERLPWDDVSLDPSSSVADLVDAGTTHMRSLVRTMVELPTWLPTLELTGGRDSRLILSLLLAEGLSDQVRCITWGSAELGDVVVAGQLADRFDLDLRAEGRPRRAPNPRASRTASVGAPIGERILAGSPPTPRPPEPAYRDALLHHTWLSSGAVSIWDGSRVVRTLTSSLALTGQFGEVMRTHFPRTDGVGSPEDLRAFVAAGAFGFDAAGVLRPDARRSYDAALLEQLESRRRPGRTARDAVDDYFVLGRLRRWFGALHENETRNRLFPLYSLPAFRAAFAVGSDARRAESVVFEIMRSCNDDLARLPFAGRPWPAEVAPGAEVAGYPVGPPLARWRPPRVPSLRHRVKTLMRPHQMTRRSGRVDTAGEESRTRDLDRKIPVLHDLVDLPPSHAFHDLVDKGALSRAIDDLPTLPFLARRAVHDAVTAAVWLSATEAPAHRTGASS